MKSKHAAVICLSAPYPTNDGSRIRAGAVIGALQEMGFRVTAMYPRMPGDAECGSIEEAMGLEEAISVPYLGKASLHIRILRRIPGRLFRRLARRFRFWSIKLRGETEQILAHLASRRTFDLVITEYSVLTPVAKLVQAPIRILDVCDILSYHQHLRAEIEEEYWDWRKNASHDFLEVDAIPRLAPKLTKEEGEFYAVYDGLIHIAAAEEVAVARILPGIPHTLIPPTAVLPDPEVKTYNGLPILCFSPNIFNVQGLFHFVEKILPLVLLKIPGFKIRVTGEVPEELRSHPALSCTGHVPDLGKWLHESSFSVVVAFNGTGQQLKIPEAMGYALPVVAYARRVEIAALGSNAEGVLLAEGERDFADYVIRLWRDRGEAAHLGALARKTVENDLSQASFNTKFATFAAQLGVQR